MPIQIEKGDILFVGIGEPGKKTTQCIGKCIIRIKDMEYGQYKVKYLWTSGFGGCGTILHSCPTLNPILLWRGKEKIKIKWKMKGDKNE